MVSARRASPLPLALAGLLAALPAWALEGAPVRFLNRSGASVSLRCLEVEGTLRGPQRSELWVRAGAAAARRMHPPDASFGRDGAVLTLAAEEQATFTLVFPSEPDDGEDLTDHYLLQARSGGADFTLIYTAAVFREPDNDPVAGGILEEHAAGREPGPAILEHPTLAGGVLDGSELVFRGLRVAPGP
jgi:hypothetical protein